MVSSFMDVGAGERRTLADIIMDKVGRISIYSCHALAAPGPLRKPLGTSQ